MNLNIFDSTKHWCYTPEDEQAEVQFSQLQQQAREVLPKGFFDRNALSFLRGMKTTKLYTALQTLPKGVLHNVFFDTIEDRQFYRKHIITHPNVYVTEDFISFRIGTAQEAQRYGWISMKQAKKLFKTEERFVDALFSITNFTEEEVSSVLKDKKKVWSLLQRKISNTGTLIYAQDIFQKYVKHILQKLIGDGYQRVEFRAELVRLSQYDCNGKLTAKLPESAFPQTFDAAFSQIEEYFPHFSVGFIFGFRKSLSEAAIQADLSKLCELNWARAVGIDFFQEEDLYGSLQKYDQIVERVMSRYPSIRLWKCYHAGETQNHMSRNIEEAVMAGSVRIGHGLNVLQRSEFLPFCKHVCFEKCPLSNLLLGYTGDPRESSAPILLGLGYAVSINMGDSGKFGAEDSTFDFFVSSVSYDWTLKHLKLVVLHSLNHCLTKERHRRQMLRQFNEKWNDWVLGFLQLTAGTSTPNGERRLKRSLDIFTSTNNWQFSAKDEQAAQVFERLRCKDIAGLPENFFGKYALTHLYHIRSGELYDVLKDMPKGVLHHLHFDCTEDEEFYREHIITDPNVYLDAQKKHFKIGTKEQAEKEGWVSFAQLGEEFADRRKLIHFVANITMLQKEQLEVISGVQHDFWVLFEQKIGSFFVLLFTLHIFKKYVRHVLLKYLKNGYQRVEFRALLVKLQEYDAHGAFIKEHDEGQFMAAFDQVYHQVRQQHPSFTAGFIFFGLKFDTEEGNFSRLDKACSYEWPRMIGIDFVQQEDPYGSMEPYIRVGDRILKKWAHLNLKKVYHAGQTKDHTNNNVEQAVRSGSVRIGHGLNIVKRIEYLNQCRQICFQLNPISNLLTGGMSDLRMSPAPLLLGLGYAVSISPDDPGKFGYEDSTVDFFASAVSFNWTLRHFKLVAYHSINHAIVTQGERIQLLESFNKGWDEWVERLIDRDRYAKRPPCSQQPIQADTKRVILRIVGRSNPVILSRINST